MSDNNLAEIRNEKAKKIQHPKGKLTAYERLELLLDEGSFSEIDQHVTSEENPDGEAVERVQAQFMDVQCLYLAKIFPSWEEVWVRL